MRHERALLAIALLLGALPRLSGLADRPLDAGEAAHAWRAAWAVTGGAAVADDVTNPFLTSAQAVLFALAGPTTTLARLPAALCGLALLLVPLLVKDALGTTRTIALAVLLAADPTLVRVARDAAGASAAVLAASLAAACLVRWRTAGRTDARRGRGWAVAAAAALGIALTTGTEAWSLAPLVVLVALALRPWASCRPRWRHGAAAFVASSLLGATAGLWALPWASGVSASLTAGLTGLSGPLESGALLALGAEPLTIALAVCGIASAAVDAPRRACALLLALAWASWTALHSPAPPAALAAVLVFAGADGAAFVVEQARRPGRRSWLTASAALAGAVQLACAARPLMPDSSVAARPDLERLAADLERVSVLEGREAHELPVLVLGERDDPSVRWALRRARAVRYVPYRSPEPRGGRPALVWPSTGRPIVPPAGYVGATYASAGGNVLLWVPLE